MDFRRKNRRLTLKKQEKAGDLKIQKQREKKSFTRVKIKQKSFVPDTGVVDSKDEIFSVSAVV